MDNKALYNLTYGVYLATARDGERDNACIINTAVQVANNPTRISIALIKGTLTHDMILSDGKCGVSDSGGGRQVRQRATAGALSGRIAAGSTGDCA